jgi:hypothetical protein
MLKARLCESQTLAAAMVPQSVQSNALDVRRIWQRPALNGRVRSGACRRYD